MMLAADEMKWEKGIEQAREERRGKRDLELSENVERTDRHQWEGEEKEEIDRQPVIRREKTKEFQQEKMKIVVRQRHIAQIQARGRTQAGIAQMPGMIEHAFDQHAIEHRFTV